MNKMHSYGLGYDYITGLSKAEILVYGITQSEKLSSLWQKSM